MVEERPRIQAVAGAIGLPAWEGRRRPRLGDYRTLQVVLKGNLED